MPVLPAAHFERWTAQGPTPLHIEQDGHIWGHVTDPNACMRGGSDCRLLPDGLVAGFHVGAVVDLDDGRQIRTGPITFGGLHAERGLTYSQVRRLRSEDASRVAARVVAWPDPPHGIAVTGSLVPDLSEREVAQLATSGVSVELWANPQQGMQHELIAIHTVPAPASPIAASVADCGCPLLAAADEPPEVVDAEVTESQETPQDAPVGDVDPPDEQTDLQLVTAALEALASRIDQLTATEDPEPEPVTETESSGSQFSALAKVLAERSD